MLIIVTCCVEITEFFYFNLIVYVRNILVIGRFMFISKINSLSFNSKKQLLFPIETQVVSYNLGKKNTNTKDTYYTYCNGDRMLHRKALDGNLTTFILYKRDKGCIVYQENGISDFVPDFMIPREND